MTNFFSITIDDRTYYKVMQVTEFRIEGCDFTMLVHIDNDLNPRIGDVLIDENNNTFVYKSCAMIHYGHEQYPECLKVVDMLLTGDAEELGEYLAVYQTKLQ